MSQLTWHNYGWGINTDKIDIPDTNTIRNFINTVPALQEKVLHWVKLGIEDDYEPYEPFLVKVDEEAAKTLSDYIYYESSNSYVDIAASVENVYKNIDHDLLFELFDTYSDYCDTDGMCQIVCAVLSTAIDIPLICCRDYNTDEHFVIMPSYYPWEVNRNDTLQKINSEDDIKTLFADCISKLTNQTLDDLDWGEQNIEGWG